MARMSLFFSAGLSQFIITIIRLYSTFMVEKKTKYGEK